MTRRGFFPLIPAASALAQQPAGRPALDLPQFEPRSALHVAETAVKRAKFPLLDIHAHLVSELL